MKLPHNAAPAVVAKNPPDSATKSAYYTICPFDNSYGFSGSIGRYWMLQECKST
ncbi:hypothetical protein G7B40_007775 [Aetokthonos hydrillicola Thurmond2011]|jgi:hypothetical protein|uniref:Uncharacterized protein n=1 Tax=Aetokthonos hydrillicola Thurmond2011 TaxID=2712845 RepID=A0AAP5M434_9CYAN|nr:hypothetical protein [Aetokthonos hydrillicola]MBO3460597.1 hypothetical protein [Aetokthonos hydrillicola CCALA 1050]MDR9894471.1 hypothetical protein [Aetokthonos hydrillicola Thurmond2011]